MSRAWHYSPSGAGDNALRDAPCLGHAPIFDTADPRTSNTLTALAICDSCTLHTQCLAFVDPRQSYFTGVCAAIIWREGAPIPRRATTQRHRAPPTPLEIVEPMTYLPLVQYPPPIS